MTYHMWSFQVFFFFKQKTADEMRISHWSSDVCSSDLQLRAGVVEQEEDVGEAALLQRLVADLHRGDRRQRGLGRGLPDADVAAGGGHEGVPGPDRDREVERRDDPDQADREIGRAHV